MNTEALQDLQNELETLEFDKAILEESLSQVTGRIAELKKIKVPEKGGTRVYTLTDKGKVAVLRGRLSNLVADKLEAIKMINSVGEGVTMILWDEKLKKIETDITAIERQLEGYSPAFKSQVG